MLGPLCDAHLLPARTVRSAVSGAGRGGGGQVELQLCDLEQAAPSFGAWVSHVSNGDGSSHIRGPFGGGCALRRRDAWRVAALLPGEEGPQDTALWLVSVCRETGTEPKPQTRAVQPRAVRCPGRAPQVQLSRALLHWLLTRRGGGRCLPPPSPGPRHFPPHLHQLKLSGLCQMCFSLATPAVDSELWCWLFRSEVGRGRVVSLWV